MDLTYGSLFSGIGGLDLAVEATLGARAVFHSEVDRHPAAVLEAHWPGVPNLGDITEVDWDAVPRVDVLCYAFTRTDLDIDGTRVQVQWDENEPRIGVVSDDDSDELEW